MLAESRSWVWVPADAVEEETPSYRLVHYPDRSSVQWSRTDGPVDTLVDEVRAAAAAQGRDVLRWWVDETTEPTGTAEVLLRRGFSLVEELEVLGRVIAPDDLPGLDVPADVQIVPVLDEQRLDEAAEIDAEVFDWAPITPAQAAHELAEIDRGLRTEQWSLLRMLALLGGRPVGTAGTTLAGDVARLWGGSVLAPDRGRGVYRALLDARLRWAAGEGATLALVKGRLATSAPVLRRAGFVSYGQTRCYELRSLGVAERT